jgi:glyoxylase-like metal-dependent hydrolase (beta-lactamase superfamily II)
VKYEEAEELSPLVTRVLAENPHFMTGPGTNTYVVGRGPVAVIDAGPDDARHRDATLAAIAGRDVVAVLCTHHHVDHAPGSGPLAEAVAAPVLAVAHAEGPEVTRPLADREAVVVGGGRLVALLTPGHASDHVCFLLEEEHALFSGDHVMSGSTVVVSPPDGHMATYLSSLQRVLALRPARIYPGHGPVIDDAVGAVEEYIRHRGERRDQVVAALGAGPVSATEIVAALYGEIDEKLRPVAARTVLAHLQQLAEDGHGVTEGDPLDADSVWSTP